MSTGTSTTDKDYEKKYMIYGMSADKTVKAFGHIHDTEDSAVNEMLQIIEELTGDGEFSQYTVRPVLVKKWAC